jgi:putative lipoprotein
MRRFVFGFSGVAAMSIAMAGMVSVGLSGCSLVEPSSTDTPKADLVGSTWLAEDIDGGGVIDNAQSTLVFGTDGRISGRAGCNQYGGNVKLNGASLIVDQVYSTKMACSAEALMDQENRFLQALQATRSYRMDGPKLVLVDSSGTPRLRFDR